MVYFRPKKANCGTPVSLIVRWLDNVVDWNAIATVAEVVGAAAVVISLIYAAYQIKQNTIASRTATHQQWVDGQGNANRAFVDDPEISELVARANQSFDSLTEAEKIRLSFVFWMQLNLWNFARNCHAKNLMDPEMCAESIRGYELYMRSSPAARSIWEICGPAYGDEFRRYVDGVIVDAEKSESE